MAQHGHRMSNFGKTGGRCRPYFTAKGGAGKIRWENLASMAVVSLTQLIICQRRLFQIHLQLIIHRIMV